MNRPDWSVFVGNWEVQSLAFLPALQPQKDVCSTVVCDLDSHGVNGPCRTQNLERHTVQHRRAVDLEAASLVDQSVRGPLVYYPAVVEVVGECGLR